MARTKVMLWTTPIARATVVLMAVAWSLGMTGSAPAAVGTLTVKITPSTWCNPAPYGSFAVTATGTGMTFRCSGVFGLRADPAPPACCNDSVQATLFAPPGLTITGASALGALTNLNNGSGWVGGSFFENGGSYWPPNTPLIDPPFASSYWGIWIMCPASDLNCLSAATITLSSITLTATESYSPHMIAVGPYNLWDQVVPGEWIWNRRGDPWPLTLSSSDPSGVCSMSAYVSHNLIPGPSAVAVSSQWQQCPNMTWAPAQGASVDTGDYISGSGPLPLSINATNAAGRTTTYSETVYVDNDPVSLSLNSPNDPDPNAWVNHAVTVDATASAGPSGVGGTTCGIGSTPGPYSQGMTIDGDGVHTVTCKAWNNAVGPDGEPNSTTESMTVHIDESPPTITFEPQNPLDPTRLTVDATDNESGVASGSLEMAPVGTNNWTSLPTSFGGAQLTARFDDAQRSGRYAFRATACDNVGNCASSTEQLTLPLRIASDSQVSLTRIVNPVRRRAVSERVLVGWHWVTIRRDGKLVRIKAGGHFKTIKVVEVVPTCTTKRVKSGPRRWRVEQTCKRPTLHVTNTLHVPYGHHFTLHGLYTTDQGVPLPGQPVHIFAAPDNHSNAFSQLATVTTAADGSWSATLPPGPSEIIRAETDGTATVLPSSGQVTTIVPADVRLLRVWPRKVRWGATVHLVGQLLGGYLPPGGALVRLRIGYGSSYTTYGVQEHVTGDGRFLTVATFGPGDPSIRRTYWFQIASLPMGNYPYAPAASQRVPVTVGG
jgi:hypothetical protein